MALNMNNFLHIHHNLGYIYIAHRPLKGLSSFSAGYQSINRFIQHPSESLKRSSSNKFVALVNEMKQNDRVRS